MVWMSRNKDKSAQPENIPNAFGALDALDNLPAGPASASATPMKTSTRGQKKTNRGRVDIVRQTAHRGGKGVTVAKNFIGISLTEKQELAKKIQKACGVGGTVKDGVIEIQGEHRDRIVLRLQAAGMTVKRVGG